MSVLESLLIFFAILLIYSVLVYILHKKGVFKKHNISFYGPMLMWRTKKGVRLLEKIARRKRFWHAFGSFGIVFCFVTMIVMVGLFIWQTWSVLGYTPEQIQQLPGIEFAFVIPVINPIFPLETFGYVVFALVIAMIVHEFSHGILTFAGKLPVKSLGILYLIVPLGAFCEPDEDELKKTKPGNRMRIFAAGPAMNFIVVLISMCLLCLVFMSAVQPAADGIRVFTVDSDSPAQQIGIHPGMTITALNNTELTNASDYFIALNQTYANQTINISYVTGSTPYTTSVKLLDLYTEHTKRGYYTNVSFQGKGYLGVSTLIRDEAYLMYLSSLKNPLSNFPTGFGLFYIIPLVGYFQGFNPITAPFTDTYKITGPLSILSPELFWIIVNALYWIFWLNFALAIFNVLPAVPLDGGYLFKDALGGAVRKIRTKATIEQQEKTVRQISLALSLIILFLLIFPFLLKYINPFL